MDGPVTANKTLAVHTAWGRTLKDVFQRYKAMRGFEQRYQNGFDCQGLWIEVGVERELGLNSKPEIEEYGLAEFARRCREKVIWSATELTRGCERLGQWMDWGNDYFTFSDTNIEYIWRFLKLMHEQNRLYQGHRSTEWCPRCGTSISQHELSQSGVYQDKTDPSLFVRLPLRDRPGESLVVWTTTPWTLPANVAAAVKPDAEYVLKSNGEWVARALAPDATVGANGARRRARRPRVRGALRPSACRPGNGASSHPLGRRHTRRRHGNRAHRPGLWRRGLRALEGARPTRPHAGRRVGALLRRLRLAPRSQYRRGFGPDHGGARRARSARGRGADRPPLPALLALRHAAHLPDHRRLVHRRRRASSRPAGGERNRGVDARLHGQAHGRLAAEHGGLEHLAPSVLRTAAPDLRVRVRPRHPGRLQGRARGAGGIRARPARGAAPSVGGRGPDSLRSVRGDGASDSRGRRRVARRGHRPVLHARMGEPRVRPAGVRDRRREGADDRGSTRPRVLGGLVPCRLGDRDARADPALVLLAAAHVRGSRRPRSVPQGARLREDAGRARPGDARLLGEHDRGGGRVHPHGSRRHALAVLRAAAEPEPPVRLRAGARDQAPPAHALELRPVPRRLRQHRGLDADVERAREWSGGRAPAARPVARRPHGCIRRGGDSRVRGLAHRERRPCLRVVRRRRVQLVHPPLPTPLLRSRGRLRGRRHRVSRPLVRARPGHSRRLPAHAVPDRPPVARAHGSVCGRTVVGPPRRLARALGTRRRSPERGRRASPGRGARPSGPLGNGGQPAPAAAFARRRRSATRHVACGRDRRGAPGEAGLVRLGRRERVAREAEPAGARAEARTGAPGRTSRARVG